MSCVLTSWVGILLLRDRFVSERVDGQAEAQKGVRNRWKGTSGVSGGWTGKEEKLLSLAGNLGRDQKAEKTSYVVDWKNIQ